MFKREADKFSSVLLNDDKVLPWDSCHEKNEKLRKHINPLKHKFVYKLQ